MRNILITGGCGFIGANFVHYWSAKYPKDKIIVLDALTYAGNKENINNLLQQQKVEFIHGSICDSLLLQSIFQQFTISTVVNFAAESHVDKSITAPDAFIQTNVVGTLNLLKTAKSYWLDNKKIIPHHFHHISTDEVYGSLKLSEPAFKETHQYQPNSPYAASKASSDHLVRAYHETYGLNTTISNCSNNYGALHFPEKLIPLTITNILKNKSIPVYGDGQQIRDWLWVEDHCQAIERILNHSEYGEVYNVGGNNEWCNIDIVRLICKTLNECFNENSKLKAQFPEATLAHNNQAEQLIDFVQDRLGHDRRYAVDASKIEKQLNFKPSIKFEDGLKQTITWYLEHQSWWLELIKNNR